jgi:N-acetylglucosaminyl-diphospho-decaprenol L-rhamnosyltransferase
MLLRACLAALERQADDLTEIVVVDTSGAASTVEAPREGDRWRVYMAPTNPGFGAACNLGARQTRSEYLLFLNADVILAEDACLRMTSLAEQYQRTAAVGPRIIGSDGEVELSARAFPSIWTGIFGRSSLATRLLRRALRVPRPVAPALSPGSRTVDWISGACMLVRRRAFEEVGGFDEVYWMYWEDADLCRRLRDRAWDTMLCVEAGARHSTGSSGQSTRTIEAFHRSAARYHERHLARNPLSARLARGALDLRMRIVLENHARRAPDETASSAANRSAGRRVLIEALAARFGGTAYATIDLARQLAVRPEIASVTVLTRRGSIVARGLEGETTVESLLLRHARRLELLRRTLWQASRLPALVKRRRFDVVVSMSGILPRSTRRRVVCVLGNSAMYETRGLGNRVRRWAVRRTARRAHRLIAPSRSMAQLVSSSTGRPCAVAPLGVDHRLFHPADPPGDEILCVADFYRHKRHDLLLDAWLALPSPRPRLRLVGDPTVDSQAHCDLAARIRELGESDSIAVEYSVAHTRMADIYRRARLFVLPSEHESFCMPLAEAMACGVPAVVRSLASLRETGGDGASYVHGDAPDAWAAAMSRLIESDAEHRSARTAASSAASRFSWEAFAAELSRSL